MINKEKLLKKLKEALDREEKSIPIYSNHLRTAVFWTGIGKENTSQVRGMLKHLLEESKKHKEIIQNLIEDIREDDKDAY